MICEGTMETYRLYYPNDFDIQLEPTALAIGFFDGLHLGHKEVIEKMIKGTEISMKNIPNFEFPEEILRSIKAIPAGYLKYYYTRDKMLKDCHRAAKEEGTRGEVVREIEEDLFEMYKDANLVVKPKELELRGGA